MTVESFAFEKCTSISSLSFPPSIDTIGYSVVADCTSLTSITFRGNASVRIPSDIKAVAFNRCPSLTEINVYWSEGAVANAPWGATGATINYNVT